MPWQTAGGKRNRAAMSAPRWHLVSIRSSTSVSPLRTMFITALKRSASPDFSPVCDSTKPSTRGRLSLTVLKSRLRAMSSDR